MTIAIIDYGMCNLGSVRRAFEECGADVLITEKPSDLDEASHIVLPGVGAFTKGMANLRAGGWIESIQKNVKENGKPMLGICLGMQLLADEGAEGGVTKGLGLVPGQVVRLIPEKKDTRIPHVGWNEIHYSQPHPLFENISPGTDFYFVHSFHFALKNSQNAVTTTPYCGEFYSGVQAGNVLGVQFHPEKSQKPGFQLIRNFLKIC